MTLDYGKCFIFCQILEECRTHAGWEWHHIMVKVSYSVKSWKGAGGWWIVIPVVLKKINKKWIRTAISSAV
jgi:hypothetical protein